MVAITPATIASGVTAADATQPQSPITLYDRALAGFATGTPSDPAALTCAVWAGKLSSGFPVDRVDGHVWSAISGPITVVSADSAMGFTDSAGTFHGLPSFAPSGAQGLRSLLPGIYTQSWSAAMIFCPLASPGGDGGLFYGFRAGTGSPLNAGSVKIASTVLLMEAQFNSGNPFASVPRSQLNVGGPNVIVACADANTRQLALYVNSKTPALTAAGIAPNPFPDLKVTGVSQGEWGPGLVPGSGSSARFANFAAFNRSLHHDPASYTKLMRLIDAASKTYGITLV